MAKKRPKAKQASGSARMAAAGRRPVLLWLDQEQRSKIVGAAHRDGRPMTQFFIHHALLAAEKILGKNSA